ncbi:HNH endonuclease [Paenibacillus sp. XY044]|uniref:HNH endonuclease n=1 Tax=Paenibacillus sp. XY044 TaxID=2026089 RepID=UPI000B99ABC6|nr:HNH endonuclease [Paenibacillus sp. XY044]OZB98091.1 hypothetical protein CJP46_02685 [Paenibacillus sp. XY044]
MRKNNQKYRESGGYRSWLNSNKDKIQKYHDAKLMHRTHNITDEEWKKCKEYFNNSCAYCGLHIDDHYRKIRGINKKIDLHKEHVDHSGANDITNCIPSCLNCNSQKWVFELEDWYNVSNENYTYERLNKIYKWLRKVSSC